MTKEQLNTIRNKVEAYRLKRVEDLIRGRIEWSVNSSLKNWFVRFLFSLPSKPYSREEAIESLSKDGFSVGGIIVPANLYQARFYGHDALRLVTAVESAQDFGLPLKLSVADVNLLNSWLK